MVRRPVPQMLRDRVENDRFFVRQVRRDDRGRSGERLVGNGREHRRAHGGERLDKATGCEDPGRNANDEAQCRMYLDRLRAELVQGDQYAGENAALEEDQLESEMAQRPATRPGEG